MAISAVFNLGKYVCTILQTILSSTPGALENLCQSGSISNTQGLKDGNTDRHRDNITAHT